jgi:hypothetical protein
LYRYGLVESMLASYKAGRCTLTVPDPQLKGAWYPGSFNPCTYQVKNRFQNVPFKCNAHRYNKGQEGMSGPASNLLASMGVKGVSFNNFGEEGDEDDDDEDDEDDDDEAK